MKRIVIVALLAVAMSASALAPPRSPRPEQFGRAMRADSEKWGTLIREANIRAE